MFTLLTKQTSPYKTGLSTSLSHSCSAERYEKAGSVSLCIYGVCAGLVRPEKCIKGQKEFQCQRRDQTGIEQARNARERESERLTRSQLWASEKQRKEKVNSERELCFTDCWAA